MEPVSPSSQSGFLQLTPDSKSSTPRKRALSSSSNSLTSPTATSPGKAPRSLEKTPPKSKFFQSASGSSGSPTSPISPLESPILSPISGSAEKKFRSFTLMSPPAAVPEKAQRGNPKKLFQEPEEKIDLYCREVFSDSDEEVVFQRDEAVARVNPELHRSQTVHTVLKMEQIRALRFSQDSINFETSDHQTLDDLIDSLRKNGWGKGYAAINIVKMPDAKCTTLDNRRLYAVMRVLETNPRFQLPVVIHDHALDADKKTYLYPISRDARSRKAVVHADTLQKLIKEQALSADSMGYCVYARMRVLTSYASGRFLWLYAAACRAKSLADYFLIYSKTFHCTVSGSFFNSSSVTMPLSSKAWSVPRPSFSICESISFGVLA